MCTRDFDCNKIHPVITPVMGEVSIGNHVLVVIILNFTIVGSWFCLRDTPIVTYDIILI